LGVARKASNLATEKNLIPLKMLNYGKPGGWIMEERAQERKQWKEIIEQAKTHKEL
jgi:hypothetical protein